jgi:pilus assembly protein CpaE
MLASGSQELETRIRDAFDNTLNGQLRRWGDDLQSGEAATVVADLTGTGPDVVAFGDDVDIETALRLARIIDRDRPEITVMLVTRPTGKLWEAAMKAGVEVVLPVEAGPDEMREEFERALEASDRRRQILTTDGEPSERAHRVIVVTAPKGGAGKSVIASNLAVGLAASAPGKVAVVDLDLQFGDVAGALQLVPEHTLTHVARTPGFDLTSLKVFLTSHPAELYALCAPEIPAEADELSPDVTARAIELLSQEFRYVVVDTAGGLDEHCLAALEVATDFVFVGNMDVPTVRALRKEIEALDHLGMTKQHRHFVLNRSDSRVGLDPSDVEATVGLRIDVAVPSSRTVPMSLNQGVPIIQSDPRSPVTRELLKLVGQFAEVPAHNQQPASGGLLRRRNGR